MVSRLQNRNTGYSEGLFSQNTNLDNGTLNSIEGATALKLDERFEIDSKEQLSQPIIGDLNEDVPQPKNDDSFSETNENTIPTSRN